MGDAQRRATFINSIGRMLEFTQSADFANINLAEVQTRLEFLTERWTGFNTQHLAIVDATVDTDVEAIRLNDTVLTNTENRYLQAKAALVHRQFTLQQTAPPAVNGAAAPVVNGNAAALPANGIAAAAPPANAIAAANAQQVNYQVNLPPVMPSLPGFDGEYSKWPEFRDTYVPLVEDSNMVPMQKFTILWNHLTGRAADVIAGIGRSAANYAIAWRMIQETFENPRLIIQSLLKIIRELRPLVNENPVGLRYIVIKHRQVIRQLEGENADIVQMTPQLIYDLGRLLDTATRNAFEAKQLKRRQTGRAEFTIDEALNFLETRAQSAIRSPPTQQQQQQRYDRQTRSSSQPPRVSSQSARPNVHHAAASHGGSCQMCKGDHTLENCNAFLNLAPYVRSRRVLSFKVCLNCLSPTHSLAECAEDACRYCDSGRKHHRLLCFTYCDNLRRQDSTVAHISASPPERTNTSVIEQERQHEQSIEIPRMNSHNVLLATALVNVRSITKTPMVARALCDNGSQANLISEELVQKLRIPRHHTTTEINPIGSGHGIRTRGIVRLTISSRRSNDIDQCIDIHALVMKQVATVLPNAPVHIGNWPEEVETKLADPTLCVPGQIDLLLGGHVWTKIIQNEIIRSSTNELIAHDSQFGWLIYGGLMQPNQPFVGELIVNADDDLNATMQRFLEMESVPEIKHRSREEEMCEEIFAREVSRNEEGRYVVPIPIKPDALPLGASKRTAYRRYLKLEEKFKTDLMFYARYVEFMSDYIAQGHMSMVTEPIDPESPHYFIPHHGITVKGFRTVFDGSAVTTSGESFNDQQLKGERLQKNLPDCIIRFRRHRIGIRADIRQMYRQILVAKQYRNYQLIFWRPPGDKEIRVFRLNLWRRVQFLHQYFWRRWQSDYINSLVCRKKWKGPEENAKVDDIVLLRDENAPPNQWRMGRVIATHPDDEGLFRNVTLQCETGKFKRAVRGLCRLPIESGNNGGCLPA